MSTNGKDVVYVDVDDEITGIIDKVTSASGNKIVALVLPKRAATFQSVVNMKLLKKRADAAGKHLVLITSESSLMPLAGSVGLYVAKTLQSKPEIPTVPAAAAELADDVDEAVPVDGEAFDPKKAGEKPVGELAGSAKSGDINAAAQMPEETIELDNTDAALSTPSADTGGKDVAALAAGGAAGKAGKKGKDKKDKHLKVPNFEKFRLLLVLGALGIIVLIVLFILANRVLPKAAVTIQTNTTSVNSDLTPTLDTSASSVDTSSQVIPAKTAQMQKTYTGQAPASGKQNNGNTATGTVTMTEQACAPSLGTPSALPAGTALSTNGLTFVTQASAIFTFSGFSGGSCANYTTDPVNITAQKGGSQYNEGNNTSFSVSGNSSITATGSTTGGTDNIQMVVQQSDIDSATQQAQQGVDKNAIKQQLQQQLQSEGEEALPATFTAGKPSVTASAKVGDQSSNVTVTETITYTMFGVQKSDLQKLVAASVDPQIDTSKQAIQDYGLSGAQISVTSANGSKAQLGIQVTSVVGPHLDQAQIKSTIEGKKSGEAETSIEGDPGVVSVKVKLSPFWVGSVPKNPSKITITFQKASSNSGNGN